MKVKTVLAASLFWLTAFSAVKAQKGLEKVIVETYYISDSKDSTDIMSGEHLKPGSVTYRIFVDMAPGYKLQLVYGETRHPMKLSSTSKFFNQFRGGFGQGNFISPIKIKENIVALDSWITLGAVSQNHCGVMKVHDPDGSIVGGENNDGGSKQIGGGLLTNNDVKMGIPLTISDGYFASEVPELIFFNLTPDMFIKRDNNGILESDNAAWGATDGAIGVTDENHVIIAQITTEGEISFELNLQLLAPYGGVERFVARNPDGSEFTHSSLIYPLLDDY